MNFLQSEELCQYDYVVEQQYFDGDARQNVTISADIEIFCNSSNNNYIYLLNVRECHTNNNSIMHAVGEFNATPATQYCMVISNTQLEGSVFNESSDEDMM